MSISATRKLFSPASLVEQQRQDPELGWIIRHKLKSPDMPVGDEIRGYSADSKTLVFQWPQLIFRDELLHRAWLNGDGEVERYQLISPRGRHALLIRLAHEGMYGGHLGIRRTMAQLQRRAYWPRWRDDVYQQLKKCEACSRYIRGKTPRQGPLQDFMVGEPMECLGIDITGPHPVSSQGHRRMMTVVDHFSGLAEAYPIRNQESVRVVRTLMDQWTPRYGCPKQILTDQGPCFEAALFRDLCRVLQIDKVRTSP